MAALRRQRELYVPPGSGTRIIPPSLRKRRPAQRETLAAPFDFTAAANQFGAQVSNIQLIEQEKDVWCFAACAQMVKEHHGESISQAELATRVSGGVNCESNPSHVRCNRTCNLDQFDELYAPLLPNLTMGPIKPLKLKEEITHDRPVQIGFIKGGGFEGHVVLVVAWSMELTGVVFTYFDPLNDSETTCSYDDLLTGHTTGSWRFTWTNL